LAVNLFLLLLLDFILALKLVSNESASSGSEGGTNERPRNRMPNGTAHQPSSRSASQSPDRCPFLRSAHAGAAEQSHYK
jgi:hypothetical protein